MGISHYPRWGHRLAPYTLTEFLNSSVPRSLIGGIHTRNLKLCDLDETAWRSFDPETCDRLAKEIIKQVGLIFRSMPEDIKSRHLPVPSEGVELPFIEIELRTYNCLRDKGFDKNPQYFNEYTIGDLCKVRGFGAKCLVDLLTSLESMTLQYKSDIHLNGEDDEIIYEITNETIQSIKTFCAGKVQYLPQSIRDQRIPELSIEVRLDELELKTRTYNCLKASGLLKSTKKLEGQTIAQLLKLPHFGKDSLLDLLITLEPFIIKAQNAHPKPNEQKAIPKWKTTPEKSSSVQNRLASHLPISINPPEVIREARRLQRLSCAKKIRRDDPRFGPSICNIDINAKTAFELANRLVTNIHTPPNSIALVSRLRGFHKGIKALFGLKLEEELKSLIVNVKSERNRQIIAQRYGFDGGAGGTLQEVGDFFKMTRERVRQVCNRFTKNLEGKKPFAPTLDHTLKFITRRLPILADEIESKLEAEGFTASSFRLEGILNAAELFGHGIPYSIIEEGGKRIAVPSAMEDAANIISQIARRAIEHWGVTTIDDIAAQAAERTSCTINSDVVKHILSVKRDFRWLDEASGWFWLSSVPRNRVLNRIEKILSVVDEIEVSELRAGVARHYRMEGFAPPKRVLLELSRQTSWCSVKNNIITAEPRPNWEDILSDIEQFMILILKEHGPILSRAKFEELCLELGMNRTTFYMYLQNSPVIAKYAAGVYGLPGAKVPLGMIESLMPKSKGRRGRVILDYGWSQDGKIWIVYKLSEAMLQTGVAGVPSAIKRFLDDKFNLKASDSLQVGTLVAKGDNIWGLSPFFRRRGGESGDYILIIFNLSTKEATISIGDMNLLDDVQKADVASAINL